SIVKAMKSLDKCAIYYNQGELLDTNINRSPTSYKLNPESERKKYKYDVEKTMFLLKFVKAGKEVGTIAWYSVHGTSMNNSNLLVSGDNKGYASLQFEKDMNGGALPGKGPFVAAFPNGIEGDVSPNTKGARCIDTGSSCDIHTSSCGVNLQNDKCIASGPGNNMFQSTQIIGDKQYKKAKELSLNAKEKVTGGVSYIHQFVDMSNIKMTYNGKPARTCIAALGKSFAAGTTDGPGMIGFQQGSKTSELWKKVAKRLKKPTKDMITCHDPKPILLPTGLLKAPYDWQPQIIPTHIIAIGNVLIVALPAEFTTMAGRRIREVIAAESSKLGPNNHVIITSLTNEYASYVTTYEEYQAQRYEGASTIFGPHTLEAYKLQYQKLAKALVS
ncbi:neutral ceramidase-like protein, partial [Leptotrombidium deliense]